MVDTLTVTRAPGALACTTFHFKIFLFSTGPLRELLVVAICQLTDGGFGHERLGLTDSFLPRARRLWGDRQVAPEVPLSVQPWPQNLHAALLHLLETILDEISSTEIPRVGVPDPGGCSSIVFNGVRILEIHFVVIEVAVFRLVEVSLAPYIITSFLRLNLALSK